jgi:hypothetical protein
MGLQAPLSNASGSNSMTTEETQPQIESGPAPDNGQGQSQGHRRRRRRRKNKSSQQSAAAPVQGAQPQAQPAPAPPPQQSAPPPPQKQHQPQPQKRKKKFFTKSAAPAPQPGNSIAPMGQNKRKPKQKGPREFVGPMDHSYRIVNGNVADGPPSTIQLGSSRATHWEEPYVTPALIRHDAPARIYCFIEDLFFTAKIQETARKLGVKVEFIKGAEKETITRLLGLPENERPALVVFDLNNLNAKPITLIPKLKSKFKKTVSIIGFLSHLQGDLKAKATEAGCDTVMPRSAFSQGLPNLLRRYGVEEEEEYSPQPV